MLDTFKNLFPTVSTIFTLQDLKDFPYSDWSNLQERYREYERWYSGEALNETITDAKGKQIDKYPLHINPLRNTCEKHASVLLGTTLESIRHGGIPVTFIPEGEDKQAAETINKALINAFLGGGGGSLFVSNGTISQYMGGCVWGATWRPDSEEFPVQVVNPHPREFLAYPDGNNYWNLRECWFVREISWVDAKAYGYPVPDIVQNAVMPSDVKNSGYNYWYIEHWTKDTFSVQINDKVIVYNGIRMEGKNPWKRVPYVYFPHLRGSGFYGESLITEAVKGIIREMNLRNADIGDAVNADSHTVLAVRGVRGTLKAVTLPDGRKAVDLGSASGMGSGETQPDMIAVRTQSAAEPQLKFTDKLDSLYRIEVRHPAVADGVDEGSQRSSLTLTTRMWPLQSHVELERIEWTTGLLVLAKIILTICQVKGINKITDQHVKTPMVVKWSTMLPRDRDQLINELSIRKKNSLISRWHAISLSGDVDNIEEEINMIDEDGERAAELALKSRPAPDSANQEDAPDAKNQPAKEKE